MAAPTRVAGWSPAAATNTTAQTSTSFSLVTGDVLVVSLGTDASAAGAATPTASAGSVTWTKQPAIENTLNESNCTIWTGAVGATASATVTVNVSAAVNNAMTVEQWRGVSAVGNTALAHLATTGSVSLTTAAANSAVVVAAIDTNAVLGTITWTTVNGAACSAENTYQISLDYCAYFGYRTDCGAAGANTYGVSTPTGQGASVVAVELKGTVSSGTNYTASPADNAGLTDSAAAQQANVRAAADNVGLTDSVTVNTDYVRAPADSAGLTDALTVQQDLGRAPADSMGLSDTATAVQIMNQAAADSLGMTDSVSAVITTAGGTSYTANPADSLGMSDSVTVIQSQQQAPADTLGMSDAAAVVQAQQQAAADNLGLTDAAATGMDAVRVPADAVGFTDAASQVAVVNQPPADTAGVTDAVTVQQDLGRLPADAAGLTDNVLSSLAAVRTGADAMGMTDSVSAVLVLGLSLRELELRAVALPTRWTVAALIPRWSVAAQALRFKQAALPARLTGSALINRWSIALNPGDTMATEILITSGAAQYVGGTVTDVNGKDISAATFQMNLGSFDNPGPNWFTPDVSTAGTTTASRVLKLLVSSTVPAGIVTGTYYVWAKIADTPEIAPLKLQGPITVR